MSRLLVEIKYSVKAFFRNKRAAFWTFLFPIILFLLFGYIFGGLSNSIDVYYVDNDGSQMSNSFIQALNSTGTNSTGGIKLKDGSGIDLEQMLKDGKISAYIIIPAGFEKSISTSKISNTSSSQVSIYYDNSKSTSLATVSIVQQVIDGFNMKMDGNKEVISINSNNIASPGMNYFDFLLPGILAISVMTVINMAVGSITHYRDIGLFRKLSTTPFSTLEWITGKIIGWTIIVILSLILPLIVGWLAFNAYPNINWITILLILFGTAMFSGLGIIFANYAKDSESATTAVTAVTFPMMFISGTFTPVYTMPWFLQYLADISPLTYLSNGLRSAMITGNYGDAIMNLTVVAVLGIVLFGIGVAVFSWKED